VLRRVFSSFVGTWSAAVGVISTSERRAARRLGTNILTTDLSLEYCAVKSAQVSPRNAQKRTPKNARKIIFWGWLVPRKLTKYTQGSVTFFLSAPCLGPLSPLNETQRLVWSQHLLCGSYRIFSHKTPQKKQQNGHLPGANNHL
jgi:hypothetical protein